MNLPRALVAAEAELAAAGVASPSYDARALALHVLGLTRPSELAGVEELDEVAYGELVRLRAARVPLQHLVGSVGFRYLDLVVGPGVFVPRPETELVAGYVIDHLRAADPGPAATGPSWWRHIDASARPEPQSGDTLPRGEASPVVVDLCSGSGAIALSVAREVPGTAVHAVEVDPTALGWARRNDPAGEVTWHEGPVEGCLTQLDGQVDVVVSNPPYVPLGTPVDRESEQDPALALWGGPDGLDTIRQVEQAARRLLRPGGLVVVEHDVTHGTAAPEVFGDWAEVVDHEDLTRRPRFVTARWHV